MGAQGPSEHRAQGPDRLKAAEGLPNTRVASAVGVTVLTVAKWRKRFVGRGLDGLADKPRSGRPRSISDDGVAEVVGKTLEETPADATHWSLRSMASAVGYSPTECSQYESNSISAKLRIS